MELTADCFQAIYCCFSIPIIFADHSVLCMATMAYSLPFTSPIREEINIEMENIPMYDSFLMVWLTASEFLIVFVVCIHRADNLDAFECQRHEDPVELAASVIEYAPQSVRSILYHAVRLLHHHLYLMIKKCVNGRSVRPCLLCSVWGITSLHQTRADM